MSRLVVIHDRDGSLCPPRLENPNWSTAMLDIPDDLDSVDIYRLAEKLAGLLLEQLGRA